MKKNEKHKLTHDPIVPTGDYPINPFLRVPKELLTAEKWRSLSLRAKVAYSLMLERQLSSRDNQRFWDSEGYPYIIFPQAELAAILVVSPPIVRKVLAELDGAELIKRVRQYLTLPDRIYVRYYGREYYTPYSPKDEVDT